MATEHEIKRELLERLRNDSALAAMGRNWADARVFDAIRPFGRGGRVLGRLPFIEVGDPRQAGTQPDGVAGQIDTVEFPILCSASEEDLPDLLARTRNAVESAADGVLLRHIRVWKVEVSAGPAQGSARRQAATLTVRVSIVYGAGSR